MARLTHQMRRIQALAPECIPSVESCSEVSRRLDEDQETNSGEEKSEAPGPAA